MHGIASLQQNDDVGDSTCVKRHGSGSDRGDMDKQERMMASLREREKVVQQSLSASLRERDREREQHIKEEAVQHFNALMADMVTVPLFVLLSYPVRAPRDVESA